MASARAGAEPTGSPSGATSGAGRGRRGGGARRGGAGGERGERAERNSDPWFYVREPETPMGDVLELTGLVGATTSAEGLTRWALNFGAVRESSYEPGASFGYIRFMSTGAAADAVAASESARATFGETVRLAHPRLICFLGVDPRLVGPPIDLTRFDTMPNRTIVFKALSLSPADVGAQIERLCGRAVVDTRLLLDEAGKFRGTAFVRFRSTADAIVAFDACGGVLVRGRPLRLEFRRLQDTRFPDYEPPNELYATLLDRLLAMQSAREGSPEAEDVVLPSLLTSAQRAHVRHLAARLHLFAFGRAPPAPSTGGESISATTTAASAFTAGGASASATAGTGMAVGTLLVVSKRESPPPSQPTAPARQVATRESMEAAYNARREQHAAAQAAAQAADERALAAVAAVAREQAEAARKRVTPTRFPRGPDGTRGFNWARNPAVAAAAEAVTAAAAAGDVLELDGGSAPAVSRLSPDSPVFVPRGLPVV